MAEFHERNDGKIVIPQTDFDQMVGVVAALDRDALAHAWFTAPGPVELSIVWDDHETGLRCKGRLDKWARGLGIVADLKTCRDCRRFAAQMAAWATREDSGQAVTLFIHGKRVQL